MRYNQNIFSPMAFGNGAFILHKMLEKHILNYRVYGYSPKFEYFPFALPFFIHQKNVCLIHTTPDHAFLFRRKIKPLVLTAHNYMCDGEMSPYVTYLQNLHYRTDLKWFIRKSIVLADAVAAVSNFTAQQIRKNYYFKNNIRVIYNGVDTKFFKPALRKNDNSSCIHVLFSGNLSRRKGAQWIPEIASRLNDKIFISYTEGLRSGSTFLTGKNLKNIGHIPFSKMPEIYRQHDILLAPTVREGFGLSIAEAMACGLPVVASDCSAIPELIDEGKGGFLCPVGNVAAFAEKINLLACDPTLRAQMGAFNRAKIESRFTIQRMVKEYQNLFDEVLDRHR